MVQTSGITTKTPQNIMFDAGAVYVNLEETDERCVGATREGSTFVVEQDVREIAVDGVRGPLVGARRIIAERARLTVNFLELTTKNLQLALFGTQVTEETDYDVIERIEAFVNASAYVKNIALAADMKDGSTPMVVMIENALADGNFEVSTADQDEAVPEIQFTAHFDPANLSRSPWKIKRPATTI